MRFALAVLLVVTTVGSVAAQSGLGGAIDSQRREMERQRGEARGEVDAQRRALQQQQEQSLRFQLQLRGEPPPRPLICTRDGSTLLCR